MKIISSIWASKLVEHGCLAYLDHMRDVEIGALSIGSIPVVFEYNKLFPNDLPDIASDGDVYYCIDLEPNTPPIFIPPCHMAPKELRELMYQTQ